MLSLCVPSIKYLSQLLCYIITRTAEKLLKKSLRIRESLLSVDDINLGQSYRNLAALYYDQKELDKAEPLYEKALQIKLKVSSIDHIKA